MTVNKKDKKELERLSKRILFKQKVTRKQVLRAFDLQRQAEYDRKQPVN